MIRGHIVLWSKPIAQIPTGWQLCNGTNGTPDLRDRFIVGAGTTYTPGDTGGVSQHSHTFTGDGHTHSLPAGNLVAAGTDYNNVSNPTSAVGITATRPHLPPYYALAYIMKL